MNIEEIKKEMHEFKDFFGGDLLLKSDIDSCKNILDCERIIERQRSFIQDMAIDADSHLDKFKERLGIN